MKYKKEKQFNAVIWKEKGGYVSVCQNNDVASQGKTVLSAVKNLQEALELYYEEDCIKAIITYKIVKQQLALT